MGNKPRSLEFESLEPRMMLTADAADFNEDQFVDAADLAIWSSGYGTIGASLDQGDSNFDSDVDGSDFLTWQRQEGLPFEPPQQDVFFLGNSLTGGLRLTEAFRPLVNSQGYGLSSDYEQRNDYAQIVAGASLSWHWYQKVVNTDPAEFYIDQFTPQLTNNAWDTLVLQPFNQALESFNTNSFPDEPKFETWQPRPREEGVIAMANNFIQLAAHHEDLRVVIYQSWPVIPPVPGTGEPDYDALDYRTEWDSETESAIRTRKNYQELVETLRSEWQEELNPEIIMVPTGEVLYALNESFRSQPFIDVDGQTYDDVEDMFGDRVHLKTGIGRYLMAITMYSVLYNEDPRGLPIGNYNDIDIYNTGFQLSFTAISEPMKTFLQQTVWDVVSTHAYTGFSAASELHSKLSTISTVASGQSLVGLTLSGELATVHVESHHELVAHDGVGVSLDAGATRPLADNEANLVWSPQISVLENDFTLFHDATLTLPTDLAFDDFELSLT